MSTLLLDIANPRNLAPLPDRVMVTMPNGAGIAADVASNPTTRARGLIGQQDLDPAKGMLFVYPEECSPGIWMRGMLIPLDIVWLDHAGMIVGIKKEAPPAAAAGPVYKIDYPSMFVLELAAGVADVFELAPGQYLKF